MLSLAPNPNDVLHQFEFFESNVLRLIYQPEDGWLEMILVDVFFQSGAPGERVFLRLMFSDLRDFTRGGLIARRFRSTPLEGWTGAADHPFVTVYSLIARGDVDHRRVEIVIQDVGRIQFGFREMSWDLKRGLGERNRNGETIWSDAETDDEFDFYMPFGP